MDLLSTHLQTCHSILMFESWMNRYLSSHRHTSDLLSLIAINIIEQIYFERIIINTHRHISMKVMTSRIFTIRYLSPYRHISQFRIHEISCILKGSLSIHIGTSPWRLWQAEFSQLDIYLHIDTSPSSEYMK